MPECAKVLTQSKKMLLAFRPYGIALGDSTIPAPEFTSIARSINMRALAGSLVVLSSSNYHRRLGALSPSLYDFTLPALSRLENAYRPAPCGEGPSQPFSHEGTLPSWAREPPERRPRCSVLSHPRCGTTYPYFTTRDQGRLCAPRMVGSIQGGPWRIVRFSSPHKPLPDCVPGSRYPAWGPGLMPVSGDGAPN